MYLSGAYVSIVETEREGHAREIIDKIDPNTSAVVIAGGDGTLSEVFLFIAICSFYLRVLSLQ